MNRIDIAKIGALEAGAVVREGFYKKTKDTNTKTDANDLVTEYDLKAQQILISHIKKHFPNDEIIAEEEGFNETKTQTGWVIDPIDGTNPFSRKMDSFGVVIGYMVNYEAQFCVVYQPVLDELFIAETGKGTTLNGEQITIANRPFENQLVALEGFGRPLASKYRHQLIEHVYNVTGRSCGCASTMMVLKGQADSYIVKVDKIWDRIHYLLLIEAGAKLTNFAGEPYTVNQEDYFACHPVHHEKYLNIIQQVIVNNT